MRKLIVAGIITFLAVIGWISYLRYDVQQFTKEWSSTPDASSPSEQHVKHTATVSSVVAPDNIIESTTGDEKVSSLPTEGGPAGTSEDGVHPDRVGSNTEKGGDVLESSQTSDGTKLSPEIVALYTDLQPLYDEYAIASWEYMQVMTKMHESVNRKKEITQELEATSDPETERTLRVELKELQTWITANYSTYQELNNEAVRRNDVMKTFLKSRGYSSVDWQVFFTWRGELSK